MVRSVLVTVRVDWIRGSWTCSPAPQPKAGSKPAAGSELGSMATTTVSVPWAGPSAAGSPAEALPPAAGQGAGRQGGSQEEADKVFSFHGTALPHLAEFFLPQLPQGLLEDRLVGDAVLRASSAASSNSGFTWVMP